MFSVLLCKKIGGIEIITVFPTKTVRNDVILTSYYRIRDKINRIYAPSIKIPSKLIGYYINCTYHRMNGPAFISYDNFAVTAMSYYKHGTYFREKGPQCILILENEIKEHYYVNGKLDSTNTYFI